MYGFVYFSGSLSLSSLLSFISCVLPFCLRYVLNTEALNVQECIFCSLTLFCSPSLFFCLTFFFFYFPSFFGEDFQAVLKYFNVFLWAAFISALLASGARTAYSFSKKCSSFFNNTLKVNLPKIGHFWKNNLNIGLSFRN